MKLLVKYIYLLLLFSMLTFAVGGIIFYFNLKTQIYQEVDQSLELEKSRIIQKLMVSDTIPVFYTNFENQISVENKEDIKFSYQKISDTLIYDPIENDFIPFRKLESVISLYTRTYKIDICKSMINKGDLIKDIFILMLSLFLSLMIIMVLVNFFISRKLLAPFYTTLNTIKNYNVTRRPGLKLPKTKTKEFTMLNEVLNLMSEKIYSDFISLKEFSENASHEMQTPLSIIKANIEMIIQDENLSKDQLRYIQSINDSATKLSKISRTLVLLARIENMQFQATSEINIQEQIEKITDNFSELIIQKELRIEKKYQNSLVVSMSPLLAEILFTNLLSNAIKHNVQQGEIKIVIKGSEVYIINSGHELKSKPEEMFQRFSKESFRTDSLGLGLAIVKKIAETSGIEIEYSYHNHLHTIHLTFNLKK